jgi:hypothetical protein
MENISEKDKLEARRLADQLGLGKLPETDLVMLLKAANMANTRRGSLDVASLSPEDEPAHVFVLPGTR